MTIKQIINQLFALTIILLILYVTAALLSAVKFLGSDPLTQSMPYHHVNAFGHVMLTLAVMTGLFGSGLLMASEINASNPQASVILIWVTRGWMLLLGAAFLSGLFGLLEGRHMLELPLLLDILQVMLATVFIVCVFSTAKQRNACIVVWIAGISIAILGSLLGLPNTPDVLRGELLQGVAVGVSVYIGYPLAVIAISFWLTGGQDKQLYGSAGLMAVAGSLLTVGTLHSVNPDTLNAFLSTLAAIFVPIAYLVFVALSFRKASQWQVLAILLLLSGGVLGGFETFPGINQWTQGTRLSDLQVTLMFWATVTLVFAVMQRLVERQGMWGTLSFWLMAPGVVVATIALAGAGLVQTYMERILSIGYLETQTYLIPLYLIWLIGLLTLSLGIAVFALRHVLRRA